MTKKGAADPNTKLYLLQQKLHSNLKRKSIPNCVTKAFTQQQQ